MKILGLDPGLGTTGWGLIEAEGNRLKHIAHGQLKTDSGAALPRRLAHLADQLEALIADHSPASAAVEEVFVNKNPQSTLKLGQARGVVIMIAARAGLDVGEYAARLVKKAVVGSGAAEKTQVVGKVFNPDRHCTVRSVPKIHRAQIPQYRRSRHPQRMRKQFVV